MKPEKINDLIPSVNRPPDFELSHFREEIDDMDISDEQAQVILNALWKFMFTFASIAHGEDIVQIFFKQLFGQVANDNKLQTKETQEKGSMDE
ncbi:MAG: hypothetical protein ACRBB4_15650 [Neptuniibacter sp.]